MTLFRPAPAGDSTELHAARCGQCERVCFPSRETCPACGAGTAAITLGGPARLRAHSAVLAQPPGALVQAPYEVGVAEFDEGLCVIGLMDGPAERGDLVHPVVAEPYAGGLIFAFRKLS
jgi:uncharacterized OB-fold protein